MENKKAKKSVFENPLFGTRIRSANAKLFPEGLIGYLVGPTLAMLTNSILAGYLNTYMTNVLNITSWAPAFFTWLPVLSVIVVVIGNILVGKLMDRNVTKAGKARPLLLLSLPLSILALLLIFVITPYTDGASEGIPMLTLIMLAIGYNLWFAIAYPFYYTPHSALVSLSTRNSRSRSLLATISNATMLAAMGLSSMVLPFFLKFLFIEAETLADGTIIYDTVGSYNNWKIFVIALIVITAIGVIMEYYFTRERVTEESFASGGAEEEKKPVITTKEQWSIVKSDKFWWLMIIFFFLYQLGGMLKNVSQIYYCQAMFDGSDGFFGIKDAGNVGYSIGNGGFYHGTISIVGAIPTAIGMVIAWPLSNKIGKAKAILFGSILSVAGGVLGLLFPANYIMSIVAFVIKALGSTPAMYLSIALLADILDHQEAKHGKRTDGLTMTIYGAIMAGMTGVATGILNGILSGVGYSATNVSSEVIRTVMPWIFFGGETICYAGIVLMFIFMTVEKYSKQDYAEIIARKKAEVEAAGGVWESPEDRLKREEAEAEAEIEENRRAELRAKCEKKGLNFEEEEAKYQAKKAGKKK